jgi:RNA polymerase sigma-70 factor (ECF subfamily)
VAPHYRDVLVLVELSEMSYAEVAQVCGIDIGTVRSRLSRGRAQLADRLSRMGLLDAPARAKEAS